MTAHIKIPNENNYTIFNITSSQSVFAIPWVVFDKADIQITIDGNPLTQSDFTFVGNTTANGGYDGGTITLNTAVSDAQVIISRDIIVQRTDDFDSGPISSNDRNTALDRATAMIQDVKFESNRSIKLPIGVGSGDLNDSFKSKLLGFDANGLPVPAEMAGITSESVTNALGYKPTQNLKDPTETPSTSNPHVQYKSNSQLGFYFGTTNYVACVGGIGTVYFNPTSFEVYPNGTDKRFAISDTSMQLHYDNIVKGVGDGSVKPPNVTWKLPDAANGGIGNNSGNDWALFSITATHQGLNLDVGAGAPSGTKTALPFKFFTMNNAFASVERLKITGGTAQAQIQVLSADLILGSNGIAFSGAALDIISGVKLALGGRSISLSPSTGAQAFYVYAATATNAAGIGTDSSLGGVKVIGNNGAALVDNWLFTNAGVLQPYTNNTLDIGASSLNVRRVYAQNIYSGSNQVLGARQTGFSAWTGTASKGAKATSTATLADVAERLKAIDDALRAHGIID